ncbi:MAG: signal recognition particle receptor subunit alpha, partial [Clostridia bacterium]|nr:signal recognition particle receptor subunit alpha [Clostridia bacterium]
MAMWFHKQKKEEDFSAPQPVTENTAGETRSNAQSSSGGFFAKLKAGLSKTRTAIFGKIDGVFSAFASVDEDLFEELEETLIMADIGVDTSVFIIDTLKKAAKEQHIKDPQLLKETLKSVISDILTKQDSVCHLEDVPSVIMV